jgi:hypothetical protein
MKYPDDPTNTVYCLCNIFNYWEILQKNQDKESLEDDVEKLKQVTKEICSRAHGKAPTTLRITRV